MKKILHSKQIQEEQMNEKPRHLLIFKLVALAGIITLVFGIVLVITGFGNFENNNFMIGSFVTVMGVMLAALGTMIGFGPEIANAKAKNLRYIQEKNKEDLTAIANKNAEIMSGAVSITANTLMNSVQKTMFCKHCGAKIDTGSKFCSQCGKEL